MVEQVRAGNADAVETLLNQPTISPSSALRAQIALFSQTGQYERVVALVDARRREVLALPVSGLLAEQLVSAYLAFGQAHGVEDALHSAQSLASALLPELERLHQADRLRELLQAERPSATPSAPTLHEQIAGIIQVAPPDQIEPLEALCKKHIGAFDLHVALGDAYAATKRTDAALEAYAQAKPNNKAEQIALLSRRAVFLLETQAYSEVDKLLPATEDLPADLIALRGAALYWLGRTVEALPLLEQAWHAGERRRHLLLPVARSWAAAQQDDTALQAYRLLLDNAPELLAAEDFARLITGLYLEGDISTMQLAQLCETYVAQGGPTTRPAAEVDDILSLRVQLWADLDAERWQMAQADYLEWLATKQHTEKLAQAFDALRAQSQRGHLQRQTHFEILESLESIILEDLTLRTILASEYQHICTAETQVSLLRNEPIPSFIQAIQRSLHFLDRAVADFITAYIHDERAQLHSRDLAFTEQVFVPTQQTDLSKLKLTIIGGHGTMRREVEERLRQEHGLTDYLEVAPSSEAHIDRAKVRERVSGRDLIVVITGYIGHDLSNLVRDLQQAGEIAGRVLWPTCRGKSGVLREILAAVMQGDN